MPARVALTGWVEIQVRPLLSSPGPHAVREDYSLVRGEDSSITYWYKSTHDGWWGLKPYLQHPVGGEGWAGQALSFCRR